MPKYTFLDAGDPIYFNGRIPHVPPNNGDDYMATLVVSIFDEDVSR